MTGHVKAKAGWMNYSLHIDGEKKPRRIYWRNHNNTYIKQDGKWVSVFFNHWILDGGHFTELPMIVNADGEWEMAREYEHNDDGYREVVH